MTDTQTRKVLDIIVHELNLSDDPALDQPLLNVGADSLDSVNIQVAIEDAFDVRWPPKDDLTADQTPQQILAHLATLIQAKEAP